MSRLLKYLLIGLAGLGLFAAIRSGSLASPTDPDAPYLVYLLILGIPVLTGLWSMNRPGKLRDALLWIGILAIFAGGYQFRSELGEFAAKAPHYLVPGAPLEGTGENGKPTITLRKGNDGHFLARAAVNTFPVTFLVDTGATTTVLTRDDALAAGIALDGLNFTVPVSTANGEVFAARARIGTLDLGGIRRNNMPVLVSGGQGLGQSLLGMNFLDTLGGYAVRGDRMVLEER